MIRFFEAMADGLLKHVNFKVVKCVIVASPGFTKARRARSAAARRQRAVAAARTCS